MRNKGDIETLKLDDLTGQSAFAGVEVDIEHNGPHLVDLWKIKLRKVMLDDLKRVIELRKALPEKDLPSLYTINEKTGALDFLSPDGEIELGKLHAEVCSTVVAAVRGWGPLEGEKDRMKIGAELQRIGVVAKVSSQAIAVQSLEPTHIFAEGLGSAQPDGAASGELGPVLGEGAETP